MPEVARSRLQRANRIAGKVLAWIDENYPKATKEKWARKPNEIYLGTDQVEALNDCADAYRKPRPKMLRGLFIRRTSRLSYIGFKAPVK